MKSTRIYTRSVALWPAIQTVVRIKGGMRGKEREKYTSDEIVEE